MTVIEAIKLEEKRRTDAKIDPVLCLYIDLLDQFEPVLLKSEINKLVGSKQIRWGYTLKGKYFSTKV